MEYFQNLQAYISRTEFQQLEMDRYCSHIIEKSGSPDARLKEDQWR